MHTLSRWAFALVVLATSAAHAAAPVVIHHSGRLLSPSDEPIAGPVSIEFRLYGADRGGQPVWSDSFPNVTPFHGVYSVVLGDTDRKPLAAADVEGEKYLAIVVDGVELAPRQRLGAAPYALLAGTAQDAQKLGGLEPSRRAGSGGLAQRDRLDHCRGFRGQGGQRRARRQGHRRGQARRFCRGGLPARRQRRHAR